jgi:sortase A
VIRRRRRIEILALVVCLTGAALVARDAWIGTKALVARGLIDRAFEQHLEDGSVVRAWSWADTHPIARLVAPRLGVSRIVLASADGPALAFGPGHVAGTAAPNEPGSCVLAGHRDTWFRFLGELSVGDALVLVTHGERKSYRVRRILVVDERDTRVLAPSETPRLTLVTCYPVDGMAPTARRLVVVAEPDTFLLDVTPAVLRLLYGDGMRPRRGIEAEWISRS